MKKLIIYIGLLFFIPCVLAVEKKEKPIGYQINVVVFLHPTSVDGHPSTWPVVQDHIIPTDGISLQANITPTRLLDNTQQNSDKDVQSFAIDNDQSTLRDQAQSAPKIAPLIPFVALPLEQNELRQAAELLEKQPGYHVLWTGAWNQKVLSNTPLVLINKVSEAMPKTALDGFIQITKKRYIQISVTLWYNILAATQEVNTQEQVNDTIQDKRLHIIDKAIYQLPHGFVVKNNFYLYGLQHIKNIKQIQYIDSALLGVLIQVTPIINS